MTENRKAIAQRILIADDDPSLGALLAEALRIEGYQPIVCTHPKEALSFSERNTFELAFVDINMPEMCGLELATRMKEHHPKREIVFITGSNLFEDAVRGVKIGAYDYLRKPFSTYELNLCLKRFQEKQAFRQQIRLAEERYYQLVQNIPLLIFVLQRTFHLEFVNDACREMLGYTREEALSLPNWFWSRIHAEERDELKRLFESAFENGAPVSMECRLLHKEGTQIHGILKSIPAKDHEEAGRERLEGYIVDISDRVFLEKALVQGEKLKALGAISAEVAHEIQNPLVSIGGFAGRLKQKNPDLRECDIILSEIQRLEKILSRIRNFLRPVEIHPIACSVNKILTDCLELLSPENDRRLITCTLDLDQRLPVVSADPEVLTQVFINLIRNAMEAVGNGGNLFIKTNEGDQEINAEFRNLGMGNMKNYEAIFMPFAQGGQSIGLPLCFHLIKDLGGMISCGQANGYMVFVVSLPKAGAQPSLSFEAGAELDLEENFCEEI